jgi:hypothetical protein
MQVLNLQAIANQEFTTFQDGDQYDISIQECNGLMAATIVKNGTTLISGQRIVSGLPLIPYGYLEATDGNFCFLCNSDDVIYYKFFGDVQQLIYCSFAEMQTLS